MSDPEATGRSLWGEGVRSSPSVVSGLYCCLWVCWGVETEQGPKRRGLRRVQCQPLQADGESGRWRVSARSSNHPCSQHVEMRCWLVACALGTDTLVSTTALRWRCNSRFLDEAAGTERTQPRQSLPAPHPRRLLMDVPTQACFWNTLSSTCLCWRKLPCWVALTTRICLPSHQ